MSLQIAIIGNVRSKEGDAHVNSAEQAARHLGRQIAIAGHEIVVYTSHPFFLERHVVSGYVASQRARPGSIHVRYGHGGQIDFPERETHGSLFDLQPDSSSDWEVTFYDSLSGVDGLLLVGGGRSTLISGLIGLGYDAAVIPIPVFGGYSLKVWNELRSRKTPLLSTELALLGSPDWNEEHAKQVVGLFRAYVDRAHESEEAAAREALRVSKETKNSAVLAVVFFVAVATLVLVSSLAQDLPTYLLAAVLGGGALCAGVSGATIRTLADLNEDKVQVTGRPAYIRTCLGIVAGLLSALLIAVPQLVSDAHLPEHALKVLTDAEREHMQSARVAAVVPLSLFSAFVTAFLLDQFYRRLSELKLRDVSLPQH